MKSKLKVTGERVFENEYQDTLSGFFIYMMHMASYRFARKFCTDKRVLDFGCGSGYGSAKIAEIADSVVAVDISQEAIDFARENYQQENLTFSRIQENSRLPFKDESFDVVLSFQVIEHICQDIAYLDEAKRLLRKNGIIIIITPDRTGRLFPFQKPWNRWHVREYALPELGKLVEKSFNIDCACKMGAPWEAAKIEYLRYRKIKWLTLPFTMPFIPEKVRIAGLNFLHILNSSAERTSNKQSFDEEKRSLTEEIFEIGDQVENPMNLIIVGRK